MRRSLRGAIVVAMLVAVAVVPAFAQQRYGSVEGKVLDQQMQPLPGATVAIAGANMMGERIAVADENGRFRIVLVPPGTYKITASLSGFQSMSKDDVPVSLGQSAQLEFILPVGTFEETLQVVADQILIDTTASQVGRNLTGDFVATLANDRQYQMVMSLMPGSGVDNANNPTIHGGAGSDNMYLVDGADNSDPMTRTWSTAMNFDNLQEIQVVTAGASAEYGRGTGAVVNLVTKSGSNEFHGTARFTYSDEDRFNDSRKGDSTAFRDATRYVSEERPSINLGGPIVRDRLWFFGSYELREKSIPYSRYNSIQDAIARNYSFGPSPYEGHYANAKLTFQLNPENTFFAAWSEDPIEIPMLGSYLGYTNRAPEAEWVRYQGGWNGLGDWTGVLTPNMFLNAKYNMKRNELNNTPVGSGFTHYSGINGGVYWGNAPSIYHTERYHDIYSLTYNQFIDTSAGGHEIKVGVDYADLSLSYRSDSYPGGGLIVYKTADGITPDYKYEYRQWAGKIPYSNETWTLFAQDSWRVTPDLTLNLGIRLERMQEINNVGTAVIDWGWGDRVQPRLGFAYNMGGNNLHGSLGRYADTVYSTITQQFSQVPAVIYDYYLWSAASNAWVFNRTYEIGARFTSKDDLDAPYMDEVTVGYQHKLSNSLAAGVDVVYRKWNKAIEDVDGLSYPNNPAADGNYHWTNTDKYREYKGIEFTLKKMLGGGRLQFMASYTYSETDGLMGDVDAQSTWGDNPFMFHNQWGPVAYDYRNVVKFNGSYMAPWGIIVGSNFSYFTGAPWQTTATVRTSASAPWPNRNFSYYLTPRGSDRLPDFWRIDFRVEKNFKVGPVTLGIYADVFNVTDNQEPLGIDGNRGTITLAGDQPGAAYTVTSGNANYGKYNLWQAPRSMFFGFKVEI